MLQKVSFSPNALESLGSTYYVAQANPKASDSNPGSADLPFKTIARAGSAVAMGDTVIISSGTYREEIPLARNGHQYYPQCLIIFKAAPGEQVYVKGSDVFDATWKPVPVGLHSAKLPDHLLRGGAYNPYALSCVVDEPGTVRPAPGKELPETLGQIYVDGVAYRQVRNLEELAARDQAFLVSGDGRDIVVHFPGGGILAGALIELTVRKQCFAPAFPGEVFVLTMGIDVRHAAEPDAFSRCRPLSIRRNQETTLRVRKTSIGMDRPGRSFFSEIAYTGASGGTLIGSFDEFSLPYQPGQQKFTTITSQDQGSTWERSGERFSASKSSLHNYFLDEGKGVLIRSYNSHESYDLDGSFGKNQHDLVLELSRDGGKTWSKPERVDSGSTDYRIQKLDDGRLFWPYGKNEAKVGNYWPMLCRLGTWRADAKGVDWTAGARLDYDPDTCHVGLDEPHACQLGDGRIFVIIRQGAILASQNKPGYPSVKLFTVSDDRGKSWSPARPLTYEDGSFIYSGRSLGDAVRSSKNGRVYLILNIADRPTYNCDPRTALHVMELDTESLCVKRKTVAIIDAKHDQHHYQVRFSNWRLIEDRQTGNILLFMGLSMSEFCPIIRGYDMDYYRYEIELRD